MTTLTIMTMTEGLEEGRTGRPSSRPSSLPLAWAALGVGLGLMYRSTTSREQQTQALAPAAAHRHAETLRALDHQHTEMLEALRQQGGALRPLIERPAPATSRM